MLRVRLERSDKEGKKHVEYPEYIPLTSPLLVISAILPFSSSLAPIGVGRDPRKVDC